MPALQCRLKRAGGFLPLLTASLMIKQIAVAIISSVNNRRKYCVDCIDME